jgi:hypothetical protein
MSTSAISSTLLSNPNLQNPLQQIQQKFQQLGSELQSGNTTAAQPDLVTLQSIGPQAPVASPIFSNDPLKQDLTQLGQDLQSGNTSAAQQDYTRLQQQVQNQDVQNQPAQSPASHGHHHHHHAASDADSNQSDSTQASQLFDQLGQQIQSGSLTQAQQTFATLQQNLQNFDLSSSQGDALSPATAGVSVSA